MACSRVNLTFTFYLCLRLFSTKYTDLIRPLIILAQQPETQYYWQKRLNAEFYNCLTNTAMIKCILHHMFRVHLHTACY